MALLHPTTTHRIMKNLLKNWKTTAIGLALILGAIGSAFLCQMNGGDFWVCLSEAKVQILAAIGLIFAKDNDQTGVESEG